MPGMTGDTGKTRWSEQASHPEFIKYHLQTETKENALRMDRKRGRMINPIELIVNIPWLKNRPRLTNSLWTSHGSVVGNLGPKREWKSSKQKWVLFLRQRFRSSTLVMQIRQRKTKARMHTTVPGKSEPLNQRMRCNPLCQE